MTWIKKVFKVLLVLFSKTIKTCDYFLISKSIQINRTAYRDQMPYRKISKRKGTLSRPQKKENNYLNCFFSYTYVVIQVHLKSCILEQSCQGKCMKQFVYLPPFFFPSLIATCTTYHRITTLNCSLNQFLPLNLNFPPQWRMCDLPGNKF